mmetsp:Transcript_16122/g.31053  ORF Transcript_16122/g.31053 Transcript_16122/m.31053 type:complete len:178 (-) Transcript_16122:385-918(-)|eukprot:CAMPEP_0114247886 /NCGR_PEP_ID=MMETSP0058-20121206/13267_1 /TAXON_ID=36894 /ORGANISM="Pyramimonas parkeae, CCMP726" /LENGTH=177 /DNA_ID=CAMNT_0001361233 /DNA_START=30 /DNA_END=563 /DNA_ORIENTATION=+
MPQPTVADRMKLMIGMETSAATTSDPISDFFSDLDDFVTLSKEQRLYGFLYCVGLGITLSILSSLFIFNYEAFAFFYTFGNVLSLGSTAFLVGPVQQLKNMFTLHRLAATLMYLLLMALTLYAVFGVGNPVLCLICVMMQSVALSWYCLSYIPYARKIIKRCLFPCCGDVPEVSDFL